MKCPDELVLQSFLDKELPSWQERLIAQHLEKCPDCGIKLKQLQDVVSLFQNVLGAESAPRPFLSARNFKFKTLAAAAAFILILSVTSGVWLLHSRNQSYLSSEDELLEQYVTIHQEETSFSGSI